MPAPFSSREKRKRSRLSKIIQVFNSFSDGDQHIISPRLLSEANDVATKGSNLFSSCLHLISISVFSFFSSHLSIKDIINSLFVNSTNSLIFIIVTRNKLFSLRRNGDFLSDGRICILPCRQYLQTTGLKITDVQVCHRFLFHSL